MGMLDGKVAVVTGAGGGIGRATALVLAANGAKVVVNDIGATVTGEGQDAGPAQRVVQEIEQANGAGRAVANSGSVASWEDAQRMVQDAIDNFGRIDIVVNNAGILRDRMFHYMSIEEWDAVIKVHLYGAFYVSRAAIPHFRKQESGSFTHITSTSGLIGSVGQVNYATVQGAVELHRAARVQPHDRNGAGPDRGAAEGAGREDAAGPYRTADRLPGHRCGGGGIGADFRCAGQ
jgi:NAD(P)-dependent dehydrogenase (short-subunit alcohol dehydrogenase family)